MTIATTSSGAGRSLLRHAPFFALALAVIAPAVRMSDQCIEETAAIARRAADELAMVWPLRQMQRIGMAHARAVA